MLPYSAFPPAVMLSSGATYSAVPTSVVRPRDSRDAASAELIHAGVVSAFRSEAQASPKSPILAWSPASSRMFTGLMSR